MKSKGIFGNTNRIDGLKLKRLREKVGWTQKYLSSVSGVSVPQIQRIEKGKSKNPGYITIKCLANALNVSTDKMEEDKEE